MRPKRLRRVPQAEPATGPGLDVVPFAVLQPAKGINSDVHLSRVPLEYATEASNVRVKFGAWAPEAGFVPPIDAGQGPIDEVMLAQDFVLSDGSRYLLRLGLQTLWCYDYQLNTWTQAATIFTGTVADHFSVTSWGELAVIGNGKDVPIRYNPRTNAVTPIVNGPIAKHYTTWANRIIASHTIEGGVERPYRIRWSENRNIDNWDEATFPSAGYEDLFSTPGGQVDGATGVFPTSDVQALIVRSSSIWTMQQTGNPEVPFRFSQMLAEVGTDARHTIVPYGGGIIFAGRDDVYMVGMQGLQRLGAPVRKSLFERTFRLKDAYAVYDYVNQEYRLAVREGQGNGLNRVWRYSMEEKAWSKRDLSYPVNSISFTRFAVLATINDLRGKINELTSSINSLGQGPVVFSVLYAYKAWGVSREDAREAYDIDGQAAVEWSITSALIRAASTLDQTTLHEVVVEVELMPGVSSLQGDVVLEWSSDRGNTWSPPLYLYGPRAALHHILRARVDVEREEFLIRLSGNSLQPWRVLGAVAFVTVGPRITR